MEGGLDETPLAQPVVALVGQELLAKIASTLRQKKVCLT
jgi:hypothetical protein